jgi:hypothetical protein
VSAVHPPAQAYTRTSAPSVRPGRYAAVGAGIFACAAGADLLLGERELVWMALLAGLGVGIAAGVIVGGAAGLLFRLTYRLPIWAKGLFWLLVGSSVSAWLLITLGVLGALEGKDRALALYSLAASVLSGLGLLAVGMVFHPSPARPNGWLSSLRLPWRAPLVALSLGAGAALIWADRMLFTGTYPTAHLALRWGGLLMAFVAIHSATSGIVLPPRASRWLGGLGIVAGLAPLILIRPAHVVVVSALLDSPYSALATNLLRTLGDPDLDGYSALLGGGDCNSFDPNIHPGAAEIPGNGIDDNCRLGDAKLVSQIPDPDSVPVPAEAAPMSVVVITIDTLRADHMSLYEYERQTTPKIDAWTQANGVAFERAYTSGGWTSLALSSLFRGVYPRRLVWNRLYETNRFRLLRAPYEEELEKGERVQRAYGMPVEEPRRTLAHWLRRRGMQTTAVVDDGFSEFLSPELGLADGYEEYLLVDKLPKHERGDRGVTRHALKALRNAPKDRPFFAWFHYFGPHNPDSSHPGVKRFGNRVKDRYDHEILFMDSQVGQLLNAIDAERRTRPIAVILTSDHGENLHKNWRNHGIDLSEESIHIPLVLSAPEIPPGRSNRLASLVDVMPTVLALTKTPAPYDLDGINLVELLEDPSEASPPRVILSELWRYDKKANVVADRIIASDGFYKLEWNLETEAKGLWRTVDRYRPSKRSYLGEIEIPHIEETLGRYLEENGRVDVRD